MGVHQKEVHLISASAAIYLSETASTSLEEPELCIRGAPIEIFGADNDPISDIAECSW